MEGVEKTAKTVDEAVSLALAQLGISREEAEIEVLEEPSRGFLGLLGSRPARVRVRVKDTPSRRAKELLNQLLEAMNLPVDMAIEEKENNVFIDIEGKDVGILIGRRGETLDALQYLLTLYVNKNQNQRCKVFLDVEGYRRRREETLQRLAVKLAEKAKQRGRNVVLEPMTSHERRIIHTALQGRDDIYTYSEGEEPYRKIIISPKK
ncbi:single-stranded nucleic acid binding R3H domain-containing protein [Desulfofundulus kuznetsovii DSM 6115]|uniref:RNA-binding protein KhpB n=1 Tax=Desulfofundulus kuznetsovii (strain DSM 6115 / VKM B-1805 / 17) TaxID=760568 RepID=A0AAU8PL03_DESK7|nr:single-stranded nucleic acid binding R3H domain-containing protein [Desulfofundulus kuznetsovii DSM 6115]